MTHLHNFLLESLKERFKANAVVEELEKQIIDIAERKIYDKYISQSIFRNDMEFELYGVNASFHTYSDSIRIREVEVTLSYTCKSKLPKSKRDRLSEAKKEYGKFKRLPFSYHKVPIWHEFHYSLNLSHVLEGTFNLII